MSILVVDLFKPIQIDKHEPAGRAIIRFQKAAFDLLAKGSAVEQASERVTAGRFLQPDNLVGLRLNVLVRWERVGWFLTRYQRPIAWPLTIGKHARLFWRFEYLAQGQGTQPRCAKRDQGFRQGNCLRAGRKQP